MKRFSFKLRNAGALVCALAVVVLLFANLYLFADTLLYHPSAAAMFKTFKTIWLLNFVAAVCAGLGNLLHDADDEFRADVMGISGVCGILSFIAVGLGFIVSGFVAGKVLLPVIMFFVTPYACLAIYVGTRCFVMRVRKIEPHIDEDYYAEAIS